MTENVKERKKKKQAYEFEAEMPEDIKKVMEVIAITRKKQKNVTQDISRRGEVIYHKF